MTITFEPLRRYMEEHHLSYSYLAARGIGNQTLYKIRHDQNISLKTLNKICNILGCQVSDVLAYQKDTSSKLHNK
mgnify:CR=1 FL=1